MKNPTWPRYTTRIMKKYIYLSDDVWAKEPRRSETISGEKGYLYRSMCQESRVCTLTPQKYILVCLSKLKVKPDEQIPWPRYAKKIRFEKSKNDILTILGQGGSSFQEEIVWRDIAISIVARVEFHSDDIFGCLAPSVGSDISGKTSGPLP